MTALPCRSCGEPVSDHARFCPSCGTATATDVFFYDVRDAAPTEEVSMATPDGVGSLSRRLLGVLAVAAVLAVGWLLVTSGGSDTDQADEATAPVPTALPTQTPTARPTPTPIVVNRPTPPVVPESLEPEFEQPVPMQLLGLGTETLVVVDGLGLLLVDLSTGQERRATGPGPVFEGAAVLDAGVVGAQSPVGGTGNSELIFYPYDDSEPISLLEDAGVSSWGIGFAIDSVADNGLALDPFEIFTLGDGTTVEPVSLPLGTGGSFSFLDGEPVLDLAGTIFVRDETRVWRQLAAGELVGTIGPGLLIKECTDGLVCSTTLYGADLEREATFPWSPEAVRGRFGLGMLSPDYAWLVEAIGTTRLGFRRLDETGNYTEVSTDTFVQPDQLVWSEDGRWLLANDGRQLFAIFPGTGQVVPLPVETGDIRAAGLADASVFALPG